MNIARLFIQRPIMTTLVMVGILFLGIVGYRLLPVSDLPNVDFPVIQVSATLPGASPETMASAVATPLEKQFSTLAGLDSMTSTSALGLTNITLQFALNRDIDAAAQDVQAAISKILNQLPRDIIPPSYQKVNPADSPILFMALTSASLPLSQLNEYGETLIAQRISMIDGVAQVVVYGSQKYAVRIQLDPLALIARGIGIDEVAEAVNQSNVNLPTGILWGAHRAYTLMANGQLFNAAAFRSMVVAYRNGAPVRLSELGRVIDGVQNDKIAAWYRENRTIMLAIQRQPGTNTVAVADKVRAAVENLKKQLPASVDIRTMFDRSQPIRASVEDVKFTLFLALCLVVLVIFLFLRNVSATLIPSMALPLSLVGTFSVMYLMGFSLDNLSLMALTLSVGFVVDDAIVMLENIVRHLEMGKKPFHAAVDGSREIGFTIVSMTVSLAAVFIPLLFMGGIIGRLFSEFAVTIVVAVLVSGVVSLTLTPMMCSRLLRTSHEQRHGRLYQATERGFQASLRFYERSLDWVMRHKRSTVAFSALILAGTIVLFVIVPKGFLPSEDYSFLTGFTEAVEGISFESMVKHQQEAAKVLLADPNIEAFVSAVGAGGPNPTGNQGRFTIRLKPRDQRELTADQVVDELRPVFARIPGIRVYLQNPPPVRLSGQLTKSLYQFSLQSADTAALYHAATELEQKMRALSVLVDVNSDLLLKNPQVNITIDRDQAARLRVPIRAIENALYSAYGSSQVSTIYTATNQYWVILEVIPERQRDPRALNDLYVRSMDGKLVPLSSLAGFDTNAVGPLTINHSGQLPSVTISFNLAPGASIGPAVAKVEQLARDTLPSSITTNFAGTAQAFKASESGLGWLLLAALLVIYLVLGILYESFVHPLTILTGLPFAGFGALATLWLFKVDLSVYSFVGLIMLIGVVKKNAIMMIDFALDAQRKGQDPTTSILQACSIRFRPIMMTTLAALMATLPIALGLGAGSASRRPLGLVVVGGLLFSQLVTLYVTPVFYVYLDAFQNFVRRKLGIHHEASLES